jgi:hypothetical protein
LARFVERICKINIEQIKRMMVTPEEEKNILKMGNGKYPLKSGGFAVVEGAVIVTIVEKKYKYKPKKNAKRTHNY